MTPDAVMDIFREAILVAIKIASPFLIASIAIGLIISVFQAATQIHEQTLTFVPKVFAMALMMLGLGTWMMTMMTDFMHRLFDVIVGL